MRAMSLFTGAAGGWDLGMTRAGYDMVAGCEIDPWRRAVFSRNFPGVGMYDDVRALTADRLRRDLGRVPDVIVGSPPCQDFSCANRKASGLAGDRGKLFLEAIRLVAECRPVWCAFENSPHVRNRGGDRLLNELEAIGYEVEPYLVEAGDFLAPHHRNRAWIVAANADVWRDRQEQARAVRPGCIQLGQAAAERPGAGLPGHSHSEGLAVGQGERGDPRPELEALERAVGPVGVRWNGGPARHFRVAHGVSPWLARQCIAAYGDAVVPQITEAIGRAMSRLLPLAEAA